MESIRKGRNQRRPSTERSKTLTATSTARKSPQEDELARRKFLNRLRTGEEWGAPVAEYPKGDKANLTEPSSGGKVKLPVCDGDDGGCDNSPEKFHPESRYKFGKALIAQRKAAGKRMPPRQSVEYRKKGGNSWVNPSKLPCDFGPKCNKPDCKRIHFCSRHYELACLRQNGKVCKFEHRAPTAEELKSEEMILRYSQNTVETPLQSPPSTQTHRAWGPCKNGMDCVRRGCSFTHPDGFVKICNFGSKCRFNEEGTCKFRHPQISESS